ncbi:hypothetical protein B566_EDAN009418 [Ephemera danica]|nr:hypothetical protein B566_EDAN009418 [Ephemera danica]
MIIMIGDSITQARLDAAQNHTALGCAVVWCSSAVLLLPALATLLLALLALLLGLSRMWPRAVATTLLATLLSCISIWIIRGKSEQPIEQMLRYE